MNEIILNEGEELIESKKGDYWAATLFLLMQRTGKIFFTNKRVVFRQKALVAAEDLSIDYANIAEISKCNVGPFIRFIPTGIAIKTKDGKKHILSVLKRDASIDLIKSNIK